jgi:hypothetical protein
MAEQLVLQDRRAEAGAVHRHQPGLAPAAVVVDGPGDQFLAGPALPLDQHRDVAGRHLARGLDDLAHRRAGADDPFKPRDVHELLAQGLVLPLERIPLDRPVHLRAEVLQVERLFDEAVGPLVHRLHGGADVAVGGHKDYRRRRVDLFDLLEQLEPVAAALHH